MDFSTYLAKINSALGTESGPNLAFLLRPTSPHGKDLVKEFRNPTPSSLSVYKGSIIAPWDDIAISYVLVCTHIAKKRSGDAFLQHTKLVKSFLEYFGGNSGWTLPALFSILRDLRDLAFDADLNAKYNNQPSQCMEEAARILNSAFTKCMNDRTSPQAYSRKWGVYYVVSLIFKSYFRVKTVSLARNILRALNNASDIPSLSLYPKSHQVTYRYYLGMLHFLDEDYVKSEQELTLAFNACHNEARSNIERILTYLLPLRIFKGQLPSSELLELFPVLHELYSPFVDAIRKGDISSYDAAMAKWEHRLLELNLWLTLEKARDICLRGLFRRVWVASNKSTRIPISMFHSALRISKSDDSVEEVECYLANMIYKGFMRGYISHEKQMVVLANVNSFPRLTDRQSPLASI
ncbi:hypothetical protein HGRIS_010087 [Hohenbuehelia grisea]|uniref:PCI domain-containing protein n=1 Tax=Hohenbuehelia grisea TaxID=104357 RepID=A0ABR3J369_9AGAR